MATTTVIVLNISYVRVQYLLIVLKFLKYYYWFLTIVKLEFIVKRSKLEGEFGAKCECCSFIYEYVYVMMLEVIISE